MYYSVGGYFLRKAPGQVNELGYPHQLVASKACCCGVLEKKFSVGKNVIVTAKGLLWKKCVPTEVCEK